MLVLEGFCAACIRSGLYEGEMVNLPFTVLKDKFVATESLIRRQDSNLLDERSSTGTAYL
jgi:hypothetical protein